MSEDNHFNHELVTRAREVAESEFSNRNEFLSNIRITLPRPHLRHLEETAGLLAQCGFGPLVLAAAFLHDHERLSPNWSFGRLEREFGSRVALLATWHSHHDQTHEFYWHPELHALTPKDLQESDSLRCAEQSVVIGALSQALASKQLEHLITRINWPQILLRFERQRERLTSHAHPFLVSIMHRELGRLERIIFSVLAPSAVLVCEPSEPDDELETSLDHSESESLRFR